MDIGSFESLLSTALRMLPPILLAGMGGMLSSRVGLLNMALEGMMLMGAFVAVVASYYSGSAYIGLISAGIFGGLVGFLFALFNIKFKADNIVVGVAVNMLALGLTKYFLKILFGVSGAFSSPDIIGLKTISLPFLSKIPILRSFNNQSIMVYVSIILVFVLHYIFYQTPLGLRIRATGSHDSAVETAGVNVTTLRYLVISTSGILCGLGGAHLSIGQLSMFTDNMTNGRGFMSMAAAIFGRNTPLGTLLGSTMFSITNALTLRLQTIGLPPSLIEIIPFAITLITLYFVALNKVRKKKQI